jgi:hypothetical protein
MEQGQVSCCLDGGKPCPLSAVRYPKAWAAIDLCRPFVEVDDPVLAKPTYKAIVARYGVKGEQPEA